MTFGTMRRLNYVLLATLQLCSARSKTFSVHEDLLAFPQVSIPGHDCDCDCFAGSLC